MRQPNLAEMEERENVVVVVAGSWKKMQKGRIKYFTKQRKREKKESRKKVGKRLLKKKAHNQTKREREKKKIL